MGVQFAKTKRVTVGIRRAVGVILPVLGLLAIAACSQSTPPDRPMPTVSVAVPLQRQVTDWDEFVGQFEALQDTDIVPRASGTIEHIAFREGEFVRKGQVLFVIDQRSAQAAAETARADLVRAEAAAENARTELARADELLKFEAISKEEREQRQTALRTANAGVNAARARVRASRVDLSFTTVVAPISGRVSDKRVSLGDTVVAGQTLLTRIVSIDPIHFEFEGAESFYLKYTRQDQRTGGRSVRAISNAIEIQLADETGYRWKGQIDFVDTSVDPRSGTVRARALVRNPDGFLIPGMFGRARLLGSTPYKALLVPDEAIFTDQTRKLVFVLDKDDKATPRPVETGPLVEGLRVIKSGVGPDERVLIDGLVQLRPGTVVKPNLVKITPRDADTSPNAIPIEAPPPAAAGTAR